MPDTKYTSKVFVSYSRSDSQQVLPLVERLERETGVHLWIDRDGIESAEQFEDVIIRAIDQAEVVLFMLSDNSQHSHWTKDEVSYAKNIGKRVVPIVLNGSDLHGWFLFKFGRVNYIDALKEDQLRRLVKDLRQWLKIGKEPAPTPKPEPKPEPALEPAPQPPSAPAPEPKPEPNPNPKPELTPRPEPKPKPDPDSVPPPVGWKKYVALALLAVILVAAVVFMATRTGEGGPGGEVAVVDFVVDSAVVEKPVLTLTPEQIDSTKASMTKSFPEAEPVVAEGGLDVQYTPSGAAVYVDGSKKGTTPCEISGLQSGSHTVDQPERL